MKTYPTNEIKNVVLPAPEAPSRTTFLISLVGYVFIWYSFRCFRLFRYIGVGLMEYEGFVYPQRTPKRFLKYKEKYRQLATNCRFLLYGRLNKIVSEVWLEVTDLGIKKSRSSSLRDFSNICFIRSDRRNDNVSRNNARLFHSLFDSNSNSNGCTYHRVVTHTQEAHHLNVCRY